MVEIQSSIVSRSSAVLDLICRSRRPLGFAEIVREMGLPKSSVHRILSILQSESLIAIDPDSNTYVPGPRLINWSVSTLTHNDLPTLANPTMEELCRLTQCHVSLATLSGTNALFIASADPAIPYRLSPRVGEQSPAHCVAVGKVLLAEVKQHRINAYLERMTLDRFTEYTITDRVKLLEELSKIRLQGHAECDREEFLQISGVGVPIFNFNGYCVAAISIWNEIVKKDLAMLRDHIDLLKQSAATISSKLGYQPDPQTET